MSILGSEDHFSRDPVQVQSVFQKRFENNLAPKNSRMVPCRYRFPYWGTSPRKNSEIHIDVSHSRQPLVKGERLVRYEVNAVMF